VNWKISWIKSLPNQEYKVDEVLKFDQKMFKNVSNINGVSDVLVTGIIKIDIDNLVYVDLNLSGVMYLPCANTNENADYPFSFVIAELLDDDFTDVINYNKDYIDLLELVWQRLIVEAPTKFVKNDSVITGGKDWRLLSEEEYYQEKDKEIDPRLAKLVDLFKDDKED
jgi:uncharacterized protein